MNEDIIVYIALCLALPIALLCFYLERRARRIMLSVMFGAAACLLAFFINTSLSSYLPISHIEFVSFVSPAVEECLKAIPVTVVVLGLKKGTRGSVSNAFSVGVGFCAVENYFYLFDSIADANLGWVCARCVSTGLMHSMSAVIIGIGIIYARNNNRSKFLGVLLPLVAAMVYHGLYNFLVETPSLIVLGAVIPAITFVIIFLLERNNRFFKLLHDTKNEKTTQEKQKP